MTKDSNELLNSMRKIEIARHSVGKDPSIMAITNITKCFNKIMGKINSTRNSRFIITNEQNTMTLVVENQITEPTHSDEYLITIHNSGQTFKVEEVISPIVSNQKITIIQYEKQLD
jgi:hypothetical protein